MPSLKSLLFVSKIVVEFHVKLKIHVDLNTEEPNKCCIISKILNCWGTDNIILKFTLSYRMIAFD